MEKQKRNKAIAPKDFIAAWQGSKDIEEVAKKLGMRIESASMRARLYRKKGIALQKFAPRYNSHTRLDVDELKKLVAKTPGKAAQPAKKLAAKRVRKPAKKKAKKPAKKK